MLRSINSWLQANRWAVAHALPGGRSTSPDPLLATLTAREREVLLEVAAGATNAEIAGRLYMRRP